MQIGIDVWIVVACMKGMVVIVRAFLDEEDAKSIAQELKLEGKDITICCEWL